MYSMPMFHSRQAKRFENGFRKEVRRKRIDFEEVDGMPKIGITIKLEHMKALFNMAISD